MTSASPGPFPEMPADRYRIERELGRGGMATVYLALDLKHDRRVALKVLDPKAHAPLAPERFQREIRFAARLQHPHILPVFDSGAAAQGDARPSLLWFSMPYVEGESLRQRLRREGRLPIADAVRIATDVARALAYAHGEGLVHRDIKPENILLTGQGDSLVADFGVGRALAGEADEREVGGAEAVLAGAGAVVGTPAYMSLEQIDGDRALDGRADIYSLGVVLYEMLTGQLPFAGSGLGAIVARQLSGPPRPLRPAREELSPALEAVVLRMLARDPVDRYASAGEVADALEEVQHSATHRRLPSTRSWAKWVAGGLAALILAAAIGGALRRRATPALELRPSVVAIAPFDVPDPDLALWREGLVDLLSRNLDGAGPLRTVPPTVIIRRWAGRADPPSAAALGLRTGAELALFGSLLGSGPDSVRLRATLLDVAREQPLGEWEVSDATDRMDRLADSLTLRLLEELGRTRPIGAVRRGGLGLTRLPVLKAFLQGEQYFRRSEWDSAVVHYGRAVALDSGFAPALRRMGHAIGWTDGGFEGVSADYRFRAGAHNHGLPARDSVLVVAESLFASVLDVGPLAIRADTGWSARLRRLFATLAGATSRYRDDPEVWFLLGDVHSHLGAFAGRSYEQQLEAYDRAIALDSAFTPSYNHAIWASGRYGETAMRRYLRAYLALGPEGMWADGARLLQRLLDSTRVATGLTVALDGVPDSALIAAFQSLGLLPDSTELAVQLGRFIVLRPRSMPRPFSDPRFMRGQVARLLLARGHLRGSREYLAGHEQSLFYGEAALLGAVPAESAAAAFRTALSGPASHRLVAAFPWWSSHGDSVSLRRAEHRADSLAQSEAEPTARARARYAAAAAAAYLSLTRGDTATALKRLTALREGDCPPCYLDRFTLVQLLAERRHDREAWQILQGEHPFSTLDVTATEVLWALLRGRVGERLGHRERAVESYTWVVGMWRNADPELQPYRREAQEGLARLTGEAREPSSGSEAR